MAYDTGRMLDAFSRMINQGQVQYGQLVAPQYGQPVAPQGVANDTVDEYGNPLDQFEIMRRRARRNAMNPQYMRENAVGFLPGMPTVPKAQADQWMNEAAPGIKEWKFDTQGGK